MLGLFRLHDLAAQRGDGLHPRLLALIEERMQRMASGVVEHPASAGCAGSAPASALSVVLPENVVRLPVRGDAAAGTPFSQNQRRP